ncbi:MAG: hypothetical protein N2235_21870 [Fischerella sp.]|nr:hypothetical protein [Fischerella sp.]
MAMAAELFAFVQLCYDIVNICELLLCGTTNKHAFTTAFTKKSTTLLDVP